MRGKLVCDPGVEKAFAIKTQNQEATKEIIDKFV